MERVLPLLIGIALILVLGAQVFLGNEIISPIIHKQIIIGAIVLVPVGTLVVYLYGKLSERER